MNGITKGVSQGGILSPVLFTIYVADYNDAVPGTNIQYADDTSNILSGHTEKHLCDELRKSYDLSKQYFHSNQLKLNATKTEVIFFHKDISNQQGLKLDDTFIEQSNNVKYLGIMVDARLNMDEHVNHVIRKINQQLPTVYHVRTLLNYETKMTYYYAYIFPHLTYGAIFFNKCGKQILKNLEKAYKRVIKILFMLPKRFPTKELFSKLRLLDLSQIIHYETASLAYRIFENIAPPKISEFFKIQYGTRMRNLIMTHCVKYKIIKNSICETWNKLSSELKTAPTLHHFKKMLRKHYKMDQ